MLLHINRCTQRSPSVGYTSVMAAIFFFVSSNELMLDPLVLHQPCGTVFAHGDGTVLFCAVQTVS